MSMQEVYSALQMAWWTARRTHQHRLYGKTLRGTEVHHASTGHQTQNFMRDHTTRNSSEGLLPELRAIFEKSRSRPAA